MADWFDNVVGSIAQGVDSAKENSKVFVEKAKLNARLQEIEKEKNNLLANMGSLVYNLQHRGEIQIDQCSGICDSIAQLEQQAAGVREQISILEAPKPIYQPGEAGALPTYENGVQCVCGFMNKNESKFCAKCGQPLSQN